MARCRGGSEHRRGAPPPGGFGSGSGGGPSPPAPPGPPDAAGARRGRPPPAGGRAGGARAAARGGPRRGGGGRGDAPPPPRPPGGGDPASPPVERGSRASDGGEVSCIFLFLWGGPPQHELWDPKPDAPSDIAGPVKPIRTSADGIQIGELLPQMARLAHQYVIVRSAHHDSDVHGNGAHANQTGLPKQANLEN